MPVQAKQAAFLHKWQTLVRQLSHDPITKMRLIIDPFDELDQFGVRWENNVTTGLMGQGDMYLTLYDALHKINPNMLLLVQVHN